MEEASRGNIVIIAAVTTNIGRCQAVTRGRRGRSSVCRSPATRRWSQVSQLIEIFSELIIKTTGLYSVDVEYGYNYTRVGRGPSPFLILKLDFKRHIALPTKVS